MPLCKLALLNERFAPDARAVDEPKLRWVKVGVWVAPDEPRAMLPPDMPPPDMPP